MSRTAEAKRKAMLERVMVRLKSALGDISEQDSLMDMYFWFSRHEAYDIVYGMFYGDDIDIRDMSLSGVAKSFYADAVSTQEKQE